MILEAISRGWENFISRPSGPLYFRFFIQPAMAIILAVLAGLRDAKENRPAYLWAMFTNPHYRHSLFRGGWNDLRIALLIAVSLDVIYQVIAHKGVYFFELLFTVTLLVLFPYIVLRGPVNRVARLFMRNKSPSQNSTNVAVKTKGREKVFTKSDAHDRHRKGENDVRKG